MNNWLQHKGNLVESLQKQGKNFLLELWKMTTLSTVNQYAEKQPAFTIGGLRSLIFNEHSNGLAESGAIIRVGRKVLIVDEKFIDWIQAQNQGGVRWTAPKRELGGGQWLSKNWTLILSKTH